MLFQLLATFIVVSASGLGRDEGLGGGPLLTELSDDCDVLREHVSRACDAPSAGTRGTTCARVRSEYARRCDETSAAGESWELKELLQVAEGDTYSGKDAVYPPIVKENSAVPGKLTDRRLSSSVGPDVNDPKRSQLHPDCKPYSHNNGAVLEAGTRCKDLCDQKFCVSYQEFAPDQYYPKGECKLYKCPPRFLVDSRRSESLPDCNPFSEHNGPYMQKTGETCSGLCAKVMGCKSYVEFAPGSAKFPAGECKLFKCAPNFDSMQRAQRHAKLVRSTAEQQAEFTLKAATKKAQEIVKKGEAKAAAAVQKADEIKSKSNELKEKALKSATKLTGNAQDTAASMTKQADVAAEAVTKKAKRAADLEKAGAAADAAKAAQKLAAARTEKAAEDEKSRKVEQEVSIKAQQGNVTAVEMAKKIKAKADSDATKTKARAQEVAKKAEETEKEKLRKETADEKATKQKASAEWTTKEKKEKKSTSTADAEAKQKLELKLSEEEKAAKEKAHKTLKASQAAATKEGATKATQKQEAASELAATKASALKKEKDEKAEVKTKATAEVKKKAADNAASMAERINKQGGVTRMINSAKLLKANATDEAGIEAMNGRAKAVQLLKQASKDALTAEAASANLIKRTRNQTAMVEKDAKAGAAKVIADAKAKAKGLAEVSVKKSWEAANATERLGGSVRSQEKKLKAKERKFDTEKADEAALKAKVIKSEVNRKEQLNQEALAKAKARSAADDKANLDSCGTSKAVLAQHEAEATLLKAQLEESTFNERQRKTAIKCAGEGGKVAACAARVTIASAAAAAAAAAAAEMTGTCEAKRKSADQVPAADAVRKAKSKEVAGKACAVKTEAVEHQQGRSLELKQANVKNQQCIGAKNAACNMAEKVKEQLLVKSELAVKATAVRSQADEKAAKANTCTATAKSYEMQTKERIMKDGMKEKEKKATDTEKNYKELVAKNNVASAEEQKAIKGPESTQLVAKDKAAIASDQKVLKALPDGPEKEKLQAKLKKDKAALAKDGDRVKEGKAKEEEAKQAQEQEAIKDGEKALDAMPDGPAKDKLKAQVDKEKAALTKEKAEKAKEKNSKASTVAKKKEAVDKDERDAKVSARTKVIKEAEIEAQRADTASKAARAEADGVKTRQVAQAAKAAAMEASAAELGPKEVEAKAIKKLSAAQAKAEELESALKNSDASMEAAVKTQAIKKTNLDQAKMVVNQADSYYRELQSPYMNAQILAASAQQSAKEATNKLEALQAQQQQASPAEELGETIKVTVRNTTISMTPAQLEAATQRATIKVQQQQDASVQAVNQVNLLKGSFVDAAAKLSKAKTKGDMAVTAWNSSKIAVKAAAKETKAAQAAITAFTANVTEATEAQQAAKFAERAASDKKKALLKEADKKAAVATDMWALYLKAFADQKSADAKAKSKTVVTDPWTKIMAEAAKPQVNSEGKDCSSVGKKFQAIIYLARDDYMAQAAKQCRAEGKTWHGKEPQASYSSRNARQLRESSVLDDTSEFISSRNGAFRAQVSDTEDSVVARG